MLSRLHARIPYQQLDERLEKLVEQRLQPEIALRGEDLDQLDLQLLDRANRALSDAGLSCTVHAPFHDLNPGALEPLVFEATALRYRQTLVAAARLQARVVVFHPGYEYWKYGGRDQLWLDASLAFWPPLLELAQQCDLQLALENVFDTQPEPLASLLNSLDAPHLGHCFDVGHWRLFSKLTLKEWFTVLGPHLCHLHLHDNTGHGDDHRPVGEGDIDFAGLFALLGELPQQPTMTLEVNGEAELDRAQKNLAPYLR